MADVADHHLLESYYAATAATTTTTVDADDHVDEGFTFATVPRLPTPAGGESFPDNDDRRVYLVFGRPRSPPPLQQEQVQDLGSAATVRVPLGQLLLEEERRDSSSPRQPDDLLHAATAETYCLWSPGGSPAVAGSQPRSPQCQERGSTAGSVLLRWRQRLLGRSNSDGRDKFAYVLDTDSSDRNVKEGGDGDIGGRRSSSFLPYKTDLAGLFANAGAFRRSYHPF